MPISSFIYSIPYLLLLTVYIICAILEYNKSCKINVIQFVCVTSFLVFFGLRGFVGWDWTSYYPSYEALETLWGEPSRNFDSIGDIGYITYSTVIRSVSDNYHFFIFISVLIDVIVLNLFFKRYSPNYAFSFAVFMVVSLGMEIDTLRNAKSIMVFLLAIPYIEQKKPLKYFALIIISILFHASSVLFIPMYFILTKRIPLWLFVSVFLVGNVIYLLQIPVLKPIISAAGNLVLDGRIGSMLDMYLENDIYSAARGINISYLERILTSILIFCYYKKITAINPVNRIFVNLFIIYIIVVLFTSEMSIIFDRVGALFVISYWILWPAIAECFEIKTNKKIYLTSIFAACYLFVMARSSSILYNYDNVLLGAKDYSERMIIFESAAAELLSK